MEHALDWLQTAGVLLAWGLVWLTCLAGVALSCLSLSGTWLVTLAALGAVFLRPDEFPTLWTVGAFVAISILVEGAEWVAGAWGVARRGGSAAAGWAAVGGGILGLLVGILIPIPVVGSLIGMMAGSFACAFGVERYRLRHSGQAAHIAWGAVVGRIAVILLKVVATLGMLAFLVAGSWPR